ncbi:hypothetical protein GCM10025881_06490 [Pseudolysinimonas kribbensis]|uniref:Uncharacterized protein n=1 Tax=Pseudolysinimonas kribbensis TaxID=433641 RepID=A0ABQ6JZR1_9MICO|nr:hypothetical protein GCM10025881_06490 [Pseudolysinimonas kribbensis]
MTFLHALRAHPRPQLSFARKALNTSTERIETVTNSPDATMVDATEAMIEAADSWLTPLDAPAVAQLRILARQLDTEATAALATSYGTAYRALIRRAPLPAGGDELEALLREATD